MRRKPILLLCVPLLFVVNGLHAQSVVLHTTGPNGQSVPVNTWTAKSSTGRTFMGSWTVVPDPATGTVAGTWTLINAEGTTLATGRWGASKSRDGWIGNWRAASSGSDREFAGTWKAGVHLKANGPFADLFEKALLAVVSGSWHAGGYSGSWTIQAFK